MRRMSNTLRGMLLAALLLAMTAGCALREAQEAFLVLTDIAAGEGPSRLKRLTHKPRRLPLTFEVEGRRYRGDLYRPGGKADAAILLIPGAAEEGRDDPRLVAFASTLARARFTVLVPDLESLRRLQVQSANVGEVADAFAWLVSRPELAPGGRAGMVAFSYGAGPALLAALETPLRTKVRFVMAVGGYHDLMRVLTFFTTGGYFRDGAWHHMPPNEYGKWVFVLGNLERLAAAADRDAFLAMTQRKRRNPAAPIDDLSEGLTAEGERLYAFITNPDPLLAPALLQELPVAILDEVAALDLANKDLSLLAARLILVHGYDDNIIPYSESEALARAVPGGRASLFLAGGLAHVDLKPGLGDGLRLWRAIGTLLAERHRSP